MAQMMCKNRTQKMSYEKYNRYMGFLRVNKGNLNKVAIKSYLELLVYLNENIAQQTDAINKLEEENKKLCIPHEIEPVRCLKYTKAEKKRDINWHISFYRDRYKGDVVIILIFAVLLIVSILMSSIYGYIFIKILAALFSIIILIAAAFGLYNRSIMNDYMMGKYDGSFDMHIKKYQQAVHEYNVRKRTEDKRMATEKKKRDFFIEQIEELKKMKKSLESELYSALSVGIIHPKYTDMKYIYKMYDYFDTGRCVSLGTSVHGMGAYNMLELENFGHKLIDSLKSVAGKIEAVERSQRLLNDSISSMESGISNMSNKIEEFMASNPLMNYENDLDQQTGRYIDYMCSRN